ncbi:MAG: tRNA uracil 4-sulfurtransferase ThiI, partial [Coriobacteriia bacterium]|nr:tRNA uracil 4-sulfurtransferase ThiI [Coriobacteriia bacterium]
MFTRACLVHYHEIGLKGKNRYVFENRLRDNLKFILKDLAVGEISRISGHLRVLVLDEAQLEEVARRISMTPGVARVSQAWVSERNPEEYNKAAELAMEACEPFHSFKVSAKRSNTDYPINSMELNQLVGAHLCEKFPDKKVQMKNPDVEVHVMINQGQAYVYSQSEPAIGGLPVGSAGKVISLLSSGIDSPVASFKLLKRGAVVVPIHFSGRPQTSDDSEYLVKDIVETLNRTTAGIGRLYVVPFGNYQREIALKVIPDLRVIMYRRLMFMVANEVAKLENAKALVTGESLGQVASQTLENILAVDEMSELPVLRPLIGSDKMEIIEVAQQ